MTGTQGRHHVHTRQQPSFKSQAHALARFGPLLGKSMHLSADMWRSSLLGKKENVVQKSGGAEPLPMLSLDLSLTRPAVLVNSQLRMLVLDLFCFSRNGKSKALE